MLPTAIIDQRLFRSGRTSLCTRFEDGYDPLFVQQQVGHSYASTTALYTSVSSDFRTRTLRGILDRTVAKAVGGPAGEGS